jgi:anaerobic magnesium-protoporphyrin IX monomethyl ester cyclase
MRIVLIATLLQDYVNGILAPISMDATKTCPPYGIYLLATLLRDSGHDVTVIDFIAQGSSDLCPYAGLLSAAELIGIGTSSLSWPAARDCISAISSSFPEIPIVLGGIHPTMFDQYVLATTGAQYVIRGEGEKTLPMLCDALEKRTQLSSIPNLTYKHFTGKIIRNAGGQKIQSDVLAEIPIPDYSRIPQGVYYGIGIETSRGCPFDCIFCSTSYRKSWRGIPAEVAVDRIERGMFFSKRTIGSVIQIIDDEFTTDTSRTIDICKILNQRALNPRLIYDARINDLLIPELVNSLSPYTEQFLVGAECGYDRGLELVGKKTTCAKMAAAAKNLAEGGIASKADFSFVIGFPWETKADVMETIRFAHGLHTQFGIRILLQWYCQIPGSRLWNEQREKEILHESLYDSYGFFRNHYLFRTGISLKPSEIFEVQKTIDSLQAGCGNNRYGMPMVAGSNPEPIFSNYPKNIESTSALANLREVANVC